MDKTASAIRDRVILRKFAESEAVRAVATTDEDVMLVDAMAACENDLRKVAKVLGKSYTETRKLADNLLAKTRPEF